MTETLANAIVALAAVGSAAAVIALGGLLVSACEQRARAWFDAQDPPAAVRAHGSSEEPWPWEADADLEPLDWTTEPRGW